MRFGLLVFVLIVFTASLALPQTKTTGAKNQATTTKKAGKKGAASGAAKKGSANKKGRLTKASRVSVPYRQSVPTPDRYKEIQQALLDKGYLKSQPTGVWDAQSSDALKQFQTDQKHSPTGKINSTSLIGLGLGPKTAQAPDAPLPDSPATASPPPPN